MALVPATLAGALRSGWLVPEGQQYPSGAVQSGDRFAGAVTGWFGSATAGAFPCATAAARRPQLAAATAAAVQAGTAVLSASQLAAGLAAYLVGQVFGPGIASAPLAVGPVQGALAAVLGNLHLDDQARADQVASAVHALAVSTIVVFPPVVSPPVPVT